MRHTTRGTHNLALVELKSLRLSVDDGTTKQQYAGFVFLSFTPPDPARFRILNKLFVFLTFANTKLRVSNFTTVNEDERERERQKSGTELEYE